MEALSRDARRVFELSAARQQVAPTARFVASFWSVSALRCALYVLASAIGALWEADRTAWQPTAALAAAAAACPCRCSALLHGLE